MPRGVVVHTEPRRVAYEDVALPSLRPTDVVAETRYVGICGSDLSLLDGYLDEEMGIEYPLVFGHEWTGVVREVGRDVRAFRPGDRVLGAGDMGPGRWFGFCCNGAASDEFVVPSSLLYTLPDVFSFQQGALIEPVACAYTAVEKSAGVNGGRVVAIVGAGTIGLCLLAVTQAMGATTVVVEPSDMRRALASELGADHVIDPRQADDLLESVRATAGTPGADLVVEASGAARGQASALELARAGGRVTYMGLCHQPDVEAPLRLIQAKDLLVRASTGAPIEWWEPALRFVTKHRVNLLPIVTATMRFDECGEAFEAARDADRHVKVHLQP